MRKKRMMMMMRIMMVLQKGEVKDYDDEVDYDDAVTEEGREECFELRIMRKEKEENVVREAGGL